MRSKEEIEAALAEEIEHRDGPVPMEEHIYMHSAGWIEALEWVLIGEDNESNK